MSDNTPKPERTEPTPDIYEIDINKKYLLTFDTPLSPDDVLRGQDIISNWIKSDEPILIIPSGARLIKVEGISNESEKQY
jgi:hypothetical protein